MHSNLKLYFKSAAIQYLTAIIAVFLGKLAIDISIQSSPGGLSGIVTDLTYGFLAFLLSSLFIGTLLLKIFIFKNTPAKSLSNSVSAFYYSWLLSLSISFGVGTLVLKITNQYLPPYLLLLIPALSAIFVVFYYVNYEYNKFTSKSFWIISSTSFTIGAVPFLFG